jgi:hypothetical protein
MALVCLLGIALAILRHALRYWGPSEVTNFAVTILVATNVLAWSQSARWQRFWVGFGLFGWAYLMASWGSSEHLPTTWLLDRLHDRMHAMSEAPTLGIPADNETWGPAYTGELRRAGHSVLSLVVGLLGGIAVSLLFRKKDEVPPDGSLVEPGWNRRNSEPIGVGRTD